MNKENHFYTKKDDKIILKCTSENIDNLRAGFKDAAKMIGGVSATSVSLRYYRYIRPAINSLPTIKRLLANWGFFMFSKNCLYKQGKNSASAKIKAEKFKDSVNLEDLK